MSRPSGVLDASALLALLKDEPGADRVAAMLPGATISAVNLAEVASRLVDHGIAQHELIEVLDQLQLSVVPFDRSAAFDVAALRRSTRHLGLSLGDRACLALAASLGAVAVTADRAWSVLDVPPRFELIR